MWPISFEPFHHSSRNLAWWCIIMARGVIRKGCFFFFFGSVLMLGCVWFENESSMEWWLFQRRHGPDARTVRLCAPGLGGVRTHSGWALHPVPHRADLRWTLTTTHLPCCDHLTAETLPPSVLVPACFECYVGRARSDRGYWGASLVWETQQVWESSAGSLNIRLYGECESLQKSNCHGYYIGISDFSCHHSLMSDHGELLGFWREDQRWFACCVHNEAGRIARVDHLQWITEEKKYIWNYVWKKSSRIFLFRLEKPVLQRRRRNVSAWFIIAVEWQRTG